MLLHSCRSLHDNLADCTGQRQADTGLFRPRRYYGPYIGVELCIPYPRSFFIKKKEKENEVRSFFCLEGSSEEC